MKKSIIAITVFLTLFAFVSTALTGAKEDAERYLNEGFDFYNSSDFTSALNSWEKGLEICRELGNKQCIGVFLGNIGAVYWDFGQYDKALGCFEEALVIGREVGDRKGEGGTLSNIGVLYHNFGQYDKALGYYEEALVIKREIGDRKGEGADLSNIGVFYSDLGQYDKALSYYEEALVIAMEIGDRRGEGASLTNIGVVYDYLGQYEKALGYYEESLVIDREIGNRKGEGADLTNIGNVYADLGQYDKALSYYEESLVIDREIGDRKGEGADLSNIGVVYDYLGQYEKALGYYEEALVIKREIGDRKGIGNNLSNIGVAYSKLGQYDKALGYFEKSLVIAKEIGNRYLEGNNLSNIGVAYSELGQYDKALVYYEEVLVIRREIGDRKGEGATLTNIGLVYEDFGQYDKALGYLEEALVIYREIGDRRGEGADLSNIGVVYRNLGQYDKALGYYEEALVIHREIGDVDGIYRSAWGMGRSYKGLKKYSEAVDYYIISIDALEEIRGELKSEEHKTTFMEDKMDVYDELIELLIEMEKYDDAFNYMERARSRAFLDMLGTKGLVVKDEEDKEKIEEVLKLEEKITRERENIFTETTFTGEPTTKEMRDAQSQELEADENKRDKLIDEMKEQNPELASLVSVNPLTLTEVQGLIPPEVNILEYFTTDEKLFIFYVSNNNFKVYIVEIGEGELSDKISNFRESIKDPDAFMSNDLTQINGNSRELYDLLITPVLSEISGEKIIIIPHGPLHYLPFSALYDGTDYLVDNYTIITDPSASVLRFIVDKRKGITGDILALGNPETEVGALPFAEKEVLVIDLIMDDVDRYTKKKATETLNKEKSSDYTIVHLACHGFFNEEEPMLSALYLAPDSRNDGELMVHELFGLDLGKSSLVVLSACQTGLSDVTKGDELIGLSRGFIYAGTPSLLVTLWSVADDSTAALMVMFYKNLKAGMEKPEALRQAQVLLKSMEKYKHPIFWAPFIMIGDWE